MADPLSWIKHRVDAAATAWTFVTLLPILFMSPGNFIVSILASGTFSNLVIVPMIVQMYRFYYCCVEAVEQCPGAC